ncbi:MAG: hypothetical protein V4494_03075 [Chlamydiota bacterium]
MFQNNGFEIILSSDIDYEHLCAEIYFNGEFVAIITQEMGIENAKIDFESRKNNLKWNFSLSELLAILEKAKDHLR